MLRAYPTLVDLQGRRAHLEVRCSRSARRGRLRLTRLVGEHGADMGLPHLRQALAGGCARREARAAGQCDVYFPQLVGLFGAGKRGGGRNSGRSPAS